MLIVCSGPAGYDRTRNAVIGNKDFDLTYLEEAYTTEHWLVRIYRVKKPHEFNRPVIKPENRSIQTDYSVSKKVGKFGIQYEAHAVPLNMLLSISISPADHKTAKGCAQIQADHSEGQTSGQVDIAHLGS